MVITLILLYWIGSMVTMGYLVTHFKEVKVTSDIDNILSVSLAVMASAFWIIALVYIIVSAIVFKLTFGRYTD